jgi:hypothetical protein
MHRNLDYWRQLAGRRKGVAALEPRPEPTLDDVRCGYEPSPVNEEEVTDWSGCAYGMSFSTTTR